MADIDHGSVQASPRPHSLLNEAYGRSRADKCEQQVLDGNSVAVESGSKSKLLSEAFDRPGNYSGGDTQATKLSDRIYDFSKQPEFPPKPGETARYFTTIDGDKASFLVHMPSHPAEKMDMVLVFHGYGIRRGQADTDKGANGFEEVSGLSKKADQDGKLLVYVEGNPDSAYSFNNGQWWFSKRNDVKLVSNIIDQMRQSGLANDAKVSAIGYSQGGSFVHTLINALPDKVGTAAEFGGWMNGLEQKAKLPVDILSIQTHDDTTAPPDGRKWWLTMLPESHTQDFYIERDGAERNPNITSKTLSDGTVTTTESRPGLQGSEVRTLWLSKGNHVWMGGKGYENTAFNVTDELWNYLKEKWDKCKPGDPIE